MLMALEKDLIHSIKQGILENSSYQIFKRLNLLLTKDNFSPQESSELKEIYENMKRYVKNIEESKDIIRRIISVIENRYKDNTKEAFYKIMKILDDKEFFEKLSNLLLQEAGFYNEGNFIDWKNMLIERQKLTSTIEQLTYKLEQKEWNSFIISIWNIPLNIAANTFLLFQKMMLRIFPNVKKYNIVCAEIKDYCNNSFRSITSRFDASTREIINSYYNTPSFKAYVHVMAQITYIDYDVYYGNADSIKDKLFQAGFRIGMDWLFIKVIDEVVDRNLLHPEKTKIIMDDFERSMSNRDMQNMMPADGQIYYFLDSVRQFQKYYRNSKDRDMAGHYLREVNQRFLSGLRFSRKLLYAKAIGRYSADLSLYDMELAGISLDYGFKDFIRTKGVAGNIFDDLKDYNVDKKQGTGYDGSRFRILCEFTKEYWKTLNTLDLKAKAKFLDFCILAGLFQLSEVVKLKERT